jgi:hypothetical protein
MSKREYRAMKIQDVDLTKLSCELGEGQFREKIVPTGRFVWTSLRRFMTMSLHPAAGPRLAPGL